jgi:hypothetical protein
MSTISHLPIHWRNAHHATILSPTAVGLISPMATPTFRAYLSLQRYMVARPVIALARTIEMCSLQNPPCLLIRCPRLTYLHIPFIQIILFTQSFTAWQLHLIAMPFSHCNTFPQFACPEKRSWLAPPHFLHTAHARFSPHELLPPLIPNCATRNTISASLFSLVHSVCPSCCFDLDASSSNLGSLK